MTLNTNRVQKLIESGKIPEGTKEVLVLPKDSNLHFLPAYYFLPAEMIGKSEECAGIPRSPLEALESEHWRGIINSKVFLQLVMEGIAFLAYEMMFPEYPDIVDVRQLQKMLGISRHLAYDLIAGGYIRGVKIGNAYKVPKINVINYVLEMEEMKCPVS